MGIIENPQDRDAVYALVKQLERIADSLESLESSQGRLREDSSLVKRVKKLEGALTALVLLAPSDALKGEGETYGPFEGARKELGY